MSELIGYSKVMDIYVYGFYVDNNHPYCSVDYSELNTYENRKAFIDNYNKNYDKHYMKGDYLIKLHDYFMLAEFEYVIREVYDKKFTHPIQYAYLAGTHTWDSVMYDIINNE